MSIEYNEDELVAPDWLNVAFFQKVMRTVLNGDNNPQVYDLRVKPATRKGDHYASIMFRVKFTYKVASDNAAVEKIVVVKTVPPLSTDKGHNLHDSHFFKNEALIYQAIVPHFEALWREHGEYVKFSGRALYAALHPEPVLVLEDLCLAGYDVLRTRLFTRDEVHACLAKLAKWHAVSHKLAVECITSTPTAAVAREALEQLQHGLFTATNLMDSPYMRNGMENMIAALERAGGFEPYLPGLRAMQPRLLQQCRRMNDAYGAGESGPIYVLNHGDFHTRNLMVKGGRCHQRYDVSEYNLLITINHSPVSLFVAELKTMCSLAKFKWCFL